MLLKPIEASRSLARRVDGVPIWARVFATPALVLSAVALPQLHLTSSGVLYAVASGALTSGVGYAVWYRVLPTLQATHAATVQLSVPVIAALGGIVLLGETATWPMLLSACAIMGGIALVIWNKR